ncbi:MAG TPA: hypothetical protein VLK22_01905 [Candidatus Udaeobacter sp.]|nr:hypothetical protein [Candidatus Udaeobacter sp.]
MAWYNFVACFFLGVFLINSLPHLVHGVSGDRFPTPFAKPPGKGLSSPILNVVWALINIVVCFLLYKAAKISMSNIWTVILFAAGFIIMSFRLSSVLTNKLNS